jgi:hypothetical protein
MSRRETPLTLRSGKGRLTVRKRIGCAASAVLLAVALVGQGVGQDQNTLLEQVKTFLEEDGWNYAEAATGTALTIPFKGDSGSWLCYAETKEEAQQFVFYSILPYTVPESKRLAVSEFITRANYGVVIGNFELDLEGGELSYKTSIDVEGGALAPTMIKNMIYLNVLMMDRYLPGLNKVVYGDADPADALQEVQEELGRSRESE